MRRKNGTHLVPNEIHALQAVASLTNGQRDAVHGYTLARAFEEVGIDTSMSTIYRSLERLTDRGFLSYQWEADPEGHRGPPRKLFRPTPTGVSEASVDRGDGFQLDWHSAGSRVNLG